MTVGLLLPFDHKPSVPSVGSHIGKCVITSNNEKKKQTERAVETDWFNYPLYNTVSKLAEKVLCRQGAYANQNVITMVQKVLTLGIKLIQNISPQVKKSLRKKKALMQS